MKHLLPFLSILLLGSLQVKSQTVIKFFTNMGNFYVEMSDSLTPITSGNFISLVDSGYYDGIIFHRVIDGFMIQGGDPTGTGSGGPGYTIEDEFDSTGTLSNIQKSISMANTGQPNSGGSQFFINLVNNTYLDFDQPPLTSKHPVFGMVIDSFDIVQDIGDVQVDAQNRPLSPVVMDSLRIFDSSDTTAADTVPDDTIPPAGIHTNRDRQLKVRVFPNPIMQNSVITVDSPFAGTANVRLLDHLGRVVFQEKFTLRAGMNRLDQWGNTPHTLEAGAYFLVLEQEEQLNTTKFIVTK